MEEIYFKNVVEIGDLYLEHVFNNFDNENIIFICMDINKNKYLAVCYEIRKSLEWILCKITSADIIRLILKRIDMRTIYDNNNKFIHIIYDGEEEKSEVVLKDDFNQDYLPNTGILLKPDCDTSSYLRQISKVSRFYRRRNKSQKNTIGSSGKHI